MDAFYESLRLTRTGIAGDKSPPAEGRVQRKETNVAPRNEGEKRQDGEGLHQWARLFGVHAPHIYYFLNMILKKWRGCPTKWNPTDRCGSTDTYLHCLSSRMAFIFLSLV